MLEREKWHFEDETLRNEAFFYQTLTTYLPCSNLLPLYYSIVTSGKLIHRSLVREQEGNYP